MSPEVRELVALAATLSPTEYDQQRKKLGKRMDIRVGTLDDMVEAERARLREQRRAERRARANGHDKPPLTFDKKLDGDEFPFVDGDELPLPHIDNLTVLLERYGFTLYYDANLKRGFWSHAGVANNTDNADSMLESLMLSLATLNGMPTANISAHLTAIYERNQKAPVAEYLSALRWDGTPRFHLVAEGLDSEDPPEVIEAAVRIFMLQAAAAADNGHTGIAARAKKGLHDTQAVFEYTFCLQASQGVGKTKRFLNIVPGALRGRYTQEGVTLDLRNKDSVIAAVSGWITELGEIDATFKKSDIVSFKAFASLRADNIRLPYARAASRLLRRVVFFGTVNEAEFLRDTTGARRFLPVTCGNIDMKLDAATVDQLWAEAWARYARGEQWWPTQEEEVLLGNAAEQRREKSGWEESLAAVFDWEAGYAIDSHRHMATEVFNAARAALNFDARERVPTQAELREVSNALRSLWRKAGGMEVLPNGNVMVPVGAESVGTKNRKASKGGAGRARAYSDAGKERGWLLPPPRKERKF